jgi:hypothetical protein
LEKVAAGRGVTGADKTDILLESGGIAIQNCPASRLRDIRDSSCPSPHAHGARYTRRLGQVIETFALDTRLQEVCSVDSSARASWTPSHLGPVIILGKDTGRKESEKKGCRKHGTWLKRKKVENKETKGKRKRENQKMTSSRRWVPYICGYSRFYSDRKSRRSILRDLMAT